MGIKEILISLGIGAIAGAIGNFLVGSKGGLIRNIIIGIIGGFIGTYVCDLAGLHWDGIIGAIGTSSIGACLLIIVGKALFK